MMNRTKFNLFIIPILLIVISATGSSGHEGLQHVIKSASEFDYPPFSIVKEGGEADGFSVELLKEVALASGLNISFEVGPWNQIKQKLIDRKIDVLPLVSYSLKRDTYFDFSAPYIRMHGTIFVRKGETSIRSESDLKNKQVLVMNGDTAHEYAVKNELTDNLVLTPSFEQAFNDLSNGKADAVIIQQLVGHQLIKKLGITSIIDVSSIKDKDLKPIIHPLAGFEQKFCIAVSEGNKDLLQHINEGLMLVIANGTYEKLYNKWFGPILPKPTLNFWETLKLILSIIVPVIVALCFLGILFLKREVKRRTDHLKNEIESHQKTNEALLESKAMFQAAMDYSQAGIAIAKAPDGKLIYVNDSALNIRGEARAKIVDGVGIEQYVASWQILHFDGTPYKEDEVPLARAILFGETCSEEFIVKRPDQEDRIVWANAAPIKNEKGEIIYGIVVFLDITKRKKAEQENKINRIRLDISNEIAVMPDASEKKIFGYVLERMLELSDSKLGFLGYLSPDEKEMQIHNWSTSAMVECAIHDKPIKFPIAEAGIWGEPVRNRQPIILNDFNENHPSRKGYPDGHVNISRFMSVPVFDADRIVAVAAVANKPTPYLEIDTQQLTFLMVSTWEHIQQFRFQQEKINLQTQIRQAQRVESIGNLAGGIAHDFNNILCPIIGMSELLLEDLPSNSIERENAEEIYKAGERGRDLVQQILAFSRQSDQKKMPTRIQSVLKEVLKLSKSTIPSYVEIKQSIQADCGFVMADPTQIHQVAMNLITNAFHSVEANGGKISVTLKETTGETGELPDSDIQSDKYAVLSVSDTGHGMSRDIQNKIFDPYFTTKKHGKGTGLGLSVVHGIVSEHGGTITVSSEIDKGTKFHVYLPLMDQTIEPVTINTLKIPHGKGERILLVDDEESVANLEKQILERLGYQVNHRINSVEAFEAFAADASRFDLVVTDMSMPNMTGDQLAKEMLAIRPDIPIIICTGFSERVNKEQAKSLGVKGFLMKPVVKSNMAQMVRSVLDEAPKNR
nr:transporter substrate-binding domain-containing protein [uncultured Desulfobacter sp.]